MNIYKFRWEKLGETHCNLLVVTFYLNHAHYLNQEVSNSDRLCVFGLKFEH